MDRRKADYERIERTLTVDCCNKRPFETKASDKSDATVLFGDLNYRINATHGMIKYMIHHGLVQNMVECDQLYALRKTQGILSDFAEGEINFAPTFKFVEGADAYVISDTRIPSYTDRILYKSKLANALKLEAYDSNNELKASDHRPVFAQFVCQFEGEFNEEAIGGETKREAVKRISEEEVAFGQCKRAVCSLL